MALIVVLVFAFVEFDNVPLKKGPFKEVLLADKQAEDSIAAADSIVEQAGEKQTVQEPDTTVKSVLLFGDSMTILVANRMGAYGKKNGYKVAAITWDASNSVGWSSADTLEKYIDKYNPDFLMVVLGSNELFLQNFDARRPSVEKLVKKMGDIPFVWIGPPNWQEDKGFNAMMERTLPKGTFFKSEGIELQRGPDHIHPTPAAGAIWTDSIMRWMPKSAHPILAELPDTTMKNGVHSSVYIRAKK